MDYTQPDMTTKPTAPPPGAAHGSWGWNGSVWQYYEDGDPKTRKTYNANGQVTGNPQSGASLGPSGIGGVVGAGGHPTGVTDTADYDLRAQAWLATQRGQNPFGNAFNTNFSYTPFGLQSQQQGFGAGAFGTGQTNASDQLTPQLEQIRMQRLLQAYPFGGK